ncbi:MAG TPA: OsmC family protein [Fimbriimonas sp.]|nr:OsmC family protein [Fimbriimonas sp.]
MIDVEWKGGRAFEANPPSGNRFTMDAYPESGGHNLGPTPMEAFLASMAACSATDVIGILEKKKLNVSSYRLEVEGERGPEGVYPRPYKRITLRHIVEGAGIDPKAVEQVVRLSDEKYCSVAATLRSAPEIETSFEVLEPEPAAVGS